MVFTEKFAYHVGELIGDIILFSLLPTTGYAYVKVIDKVGKFATVHKIASASAEVVSENLFECLPFLE